MRLKIGFFRRNPLTSAMRYISSSFVSRFPSKQNFVNLMVGRGYLPTQAHASGAWILRHPQRQLILKVGDDKPTEEFASFIAGAAFDPCLPRVFATTKPGGPYTIIVMERLDPFPQASQYDAWLRTDYYPSRGSPSTDPLGVVVVLNRLAIAAQMHGVLLDVQGKNVLLRRATTQPVFFDPFF